MGEIKIKKDIRTVNENDLMVAPIHVTIDISNNCNASCPFCSRQLSEYSQNGFMQKELFYKIISQIKKYEDIKSIGLAAWGEPMLHPNFEEFVQYLHGDGYSIGFPSNLSLARKHFNSMLKASHIMFSIEGHDKESYEQSRVNLKFETVYNNVVEFDKIIKEKRKNGEKTPIREINYLLSKNSKPEEFIKLWGPYVDKIGIRPVLPAFGWDKETNHLKYYENNSFKNSLIPLDIKVENMQCHQPFKAIFVRANGKLALCCSDYDIQLDFGNSEELLNSYFENVNLNKIRNEFVTNKLDLCANCFQNSEISTDNLLTIFPELEQIEQNNKKVKIYANR